MQTAEKKCPLVRFKGFTDDWELRRLGEITSLITKGTTPLDKSGHGEINFIKVENIDTNSGAISSLSKVSTKEHMGYLRRSQLHNGDILFSIAGTLGRVAIINNDILPANTNQALAIIRLKSEDLHYIATYLNGKTVKNFIRKNPTIGAQPNLSLNQVENLNIYLPIIKEQQHISNFFRKLDNLITFHQRKLAQLTAFKKAMLGKMFPQEGARVPEVRFSGFTDNWEQRKLGDLAEIGDIDHKMPQTVDDGIPYLMTGDFIGINELNFSEVKMISKADYERLANKIKPQKGDILFARYATVGAVRYVNFERDFLISYSCAIIKSSTKIVSKFLYQFLTSVLAQTQIKLEINTGSQANIGIDSMKNNIIVSMPTKDEQKKIGDFFFELDNLITIHQHKLTVLQQAKQSLLQKMFI